MTEIDTTHPDPLTATSRRGWYESRVSRPELLSSIWIAVLLADALRGVHETLRPDFVRELAVEGTVYGNRVTDAELAVYGVVLSYLSIVVVLCRVLPRRPNRVVNIVASLMMGSGVLLSWPKDPDDLVFGVVLLGGALAAAVIAARWTDDGEVASVVEGQSR